MLEVQDWSEKTTKVVINRSLLSKSRKIWIVSRFTGTIEYTIFSDFSHDCIPQGDGQVVSGSESLSDPVVLETEEQMLEVSRMSVMFLMHWASTSVTPECLWNMCMSVS